MTSSQVIPSNAFSIDLEDWYQGIEAPFSSWTQYERRLEKGHYLLLELLEKYNTKATFFTLGWIADHYPNLVKEISDLGHEVGSHGYSHEKVYDQTPEEFRQEIRKTKKSIEDLTGKEVTTHRSPFFSITNRSLWALPILKEEGYKIDCSISQTKTWRYGISTCPDTIFNISDIDLVEFPCSTFSIFNKKMNIGGAYFRIFPYSSTHKELKKRENDKMYSMFYVHPWEYDRDHPKTKMEWKAKLTHYTRLGLMYSNTEKLLKEFKFDTVSNVIENFKNQNGSIPDVSLANLKD